MISNELLEKLQSNEFKIDLNTRPILSTMSTVDYVMFEACRQGKDFN